MRKTFLFVVMAALLGVFGFFSAVGGGARPVNAQSCSGVLDLVLTLDESGSILGDFGAVQQFAIGIVNAFSVSASEVNIGVVSFDSSPTVRIGLSSDANAVIAAINQAPSGGGTAIGSAISTSQSVLSAGRSGAGKVMIVLSDGSSGDDPIPPANAAKASGTVIFSVAFGFGADVNTLSAISSNGAAFVATDQAALIALTSQLANITCTVVTAPETLTFCAQPLTANAVVGEVTSTTRYFWDPGKISPTGSIAAGQRYWVLGVDETGEYYKIWYECRYLWLPVGVMGPAFGDPVWNGAPLPTTVVD